MIDSQNVTSHWASITFVLNSAKTFSIWSYVPRISDEIKESQIWEAHVAFALIASSNAMSIWLFLI